MSRCPLSYEPLPEGATEHYSASGLRRLAPRLARLDDLPISAAEQRREAQARAGRMSIQGLRPKLSARLAVSEGRFEIVDRFGSFILKPQSLDWPHLPENEDLTMRLAATAGIEVPAHGLIYSRDGSLTYLIRRFDRLGRGARLPVEDFAQLTGRSRRTKYDASMEQVAAVIERFATFPAVERAELFVRTVFCFLVGNEDMHLKNFSLVTRGERVTLSPAYDQVNTTIALPGALEELALPLRGKKRRLLREDLVDYFGAERLQLTTRTIDAGLERLSAAAARWGELIEASFLPDDSRRQYLDLVAERRRRLAL